MRKSQVSAQRKRGSWTLAKGSRSCRGVSFLLSVSFFVSSLSPPTAFASQSHGSPESLIIPNQLGYIVERFSPPTLPTEGKPSHPFLVILQDIHTQPEAQRSAANLIDTLHQSEGISLVAMEGGSGPARLKFFWAIPDPHTRDQMAEYFLEQGLFSGAVAYAVKHPNTIQLHGVDDPSAYREHLALYEAADQTSQAVKPSLEKFASLIQQLQQKLYPSSYRRLLAKQQAYEYETERLDITDYLNFLTQLASRHHIDLTAYPHLASIRRVMRLQRKIKLDRVEKERRHLLGQLSAKLSHDARTSLQKHQSAFRSGLMSEASYYTNLKQFAQQADFSLPSIPDSEPPFFATLIEEIIRTCA